MIADAHVHFFSAGFVGALAAQAGTSVDAALRRLDWDDPGSPETLADRWVAELDRHGVSAAALIASVPGDGPSVATAVARHPGRFVGYLMFDPTQDNAEARLDAALASGMRGVCLFPAMHRYALDDARVIRVAERLVEGRSPEAPQGREGASHPPVLFVHCGVLSVGARTRLGLPSPFDLRRGNPLDLHPLATRFPTLPIVIPHFGAGMFRETLMLADVCPNVCVDTSSSNGWMRYTPGLTLEQVFETALGVLGPRRLLFGTDSSFFPRGWQRAIYDRQRTALERVGASAEVQALVLGGNFQRLTGIGRD